MNTDFPIKMLIECLYPKCLCEDGISESAQNKCFTEPGILSPICNSFMYIMASLDTK